MMKPETPLQQGDAAIDHHPTVVDLEAHVLNPMVNQELESRSMSSRHGGTVMKFLGAKPHRAEGTCSSGSIITHGISSRNNVFTSDSVTSDNSMRVWATILKGVVKDCRNHGSLTRIRLLESYSIVGWPE